MKAKIEIFGFLKDHVPEEFREKRPLELSFENPTSLHYLLDEVLLLHDFDKIALVNGKYVPPDYTLKDGDAVQVFSPIPGG